MCVCVWGGGGGGGGGGDSYLLDSLVKNGDNWPVLFKVRGPHLIIASYR